eukprot:gene86-3691_t
MVKSAKSSSRSTAEEESLTEYQPQLVVGLAIDDARCTSREPPGCRSYATYQNDDTNSGPNDETDAEAFPETLRVTPRGYQTTTPCAWRMPFDARCAQGTREPTGQSINPPSAIMLRTSAVQTMKWLVQINHAQPLCRSFSMSTLSERDPSPLTPIPPQEEDKNKTAPAAAPKLGSSLYPPMLKRAMGTWNSKLHASGVVVPHGGLLKDLRSTEFLMSNPTYTKEYLENVRPHHKEVQNIYHRIGLTAITLVRVCFDWATGYGPGKMNEAKWLHRIIFLETVAGYGPGKMNEAKWLHRIIFLETVAGWIHTLLEEAENERMHLLTFMELRQPGLFMRSMVLLTQGIFFNLFFVSYIISPKGIFFYFFFVCYIISPKICHALVGYLEEEAVKTYTHLLAEIDAGLLWTDKPAPTIAITYWKLESNATMRDLVLAVRADEACHSHVNHTFSDMKSDDLNPFSSEAVMIAARLMRARVPLGRPLACNARRAFKTTVARAQFYEIERTATSLEIGAIMYDSCDEEEELAEKRLIPEMGLDEFLASYMKTCGSLQSLSITMDPFEVPERMVGVTTMLARMLKEFSLSGGWDGGDDRGLYAFCHCGIRDESLMAMANYVKQLRGIIWPALKKLELTNCIFQDDNEGHVEAEGYKAIKASAKEMWPELDLVLDDMDELGREAMEAFQISQCVGIGDDYD